MFQGTKAGRIVFLLSASFRRGPLRLSPAVSGRLGLCTLPGYSLEISCNPIAWIKTYLCARIAALRRISVKKMKRKTACIALAFACIMMLVHAVLPHHHHCHEVVFGARCQWAESADENKGIFRDAACFSLVASGEDTPRHCTPLHSHDDPCWKNTMYFSRSVFHIPFHAFALLVAAQLPEDFVRIPLPEIVSGCLEISCNLAYYQDFVLPGIGFRAPPSC